MENASLALLKRILVPGLFIGLASIVFGMVFFLAQWDYSEQGHEILLIVYILLSCLLMLTLHFNRSGGTLLILIALIAILCYGYAKFDWRRDFLKQTDQGNFPAINRHISKYPTYEEHLFASYIDTPKWIAFSNDCFEPGLAGEPMAPSCGSANLIQENYYIDINSAINNHYAKMRKTALMLQNGDFTNKNIYRSCLESKNCAFIPLLPPDANPDAISSKSDEHLEVRRQFWSIINNKMIQPEACDFMDLCRVMRDAGVVSIRRTN